MRLQRFVGCGLVAIVAAGVWVGSLAGCAGSGETRPSEDRRAQARPDQSGPGQSGSASLRLAEARPTGTIFSSPMQRTPDRVRAADGSPGPDYWQNTADYAIDAELDPASNTLRVALRVRYTNNSPHTLRYLWFNLEQNLFRPGSKGDVIYGSGQRFGNRDGFEGGFNITAVRFLRGDLAGDVRALRPARDAELAVYDTLGRVDLPEAIEPGGRVALEMRYNFRVPPNGSDRMGREDVAGGRIYQFAQWFPNLCRFDDVHGWNTLPYLGAGEFYTDFGAYDVVLSVPSDHVVAATGVLQNPEDVLSSTELERWRRVHEGESGSESVFVRTLEEADAARSSWDGESMSRWRFVAEDVRTFAWAASQAFAWEAMGVAVPTEIGDVREPTQADMERSAALPEGQPGGSFDPIPDGVPTRLAVVHSFYPREGEEQWARSNEYQAFTLRLHSRMWYPYPYPQSTNVNGIVGGMEYPMVAFCRNRTNPRGLFGVTDHELVHNWFPMIVNTNEREYAWMDEGMTSFLGIYASQYFYPDQTPRTMTRFFERMATRDLQPIHTRPDHIAGGQLGFLAYRKTAYGLWLLREHILGADRFDPAFRAYIDKWAFKSPTPDDFFRAMNDGAGADLNWFWRGWFTEFTQLDQAVDGVRSEEDGSVRVRFANRGEMVMPLIVELTWRESATSRTRERVTVPVDAWGGLNTFEMRFATEGRSLVGIEIDPDGVMPDADRSNNRWRR